MADIFHCFPINASVDKVFAAISTTEGLDKWWTKSSSGKLAIGETYHLYFEPDYYWKAIVSKIIPNQEFELTMQDSDEDWNGTLLGFRLKDINQVTEVQFYHTGWKTDNQHFKISNYCWAMYLRLLKRFVEIGEVIEYKERLNV